MSERNIRNKKTYVVRHRNVVEIGDSGYFLGHQSEELHSLSTRSTQRIWILSKNWLDCLRSTPPQISTHFSYSLSIQSSVSSKIFEFLLDCILFLSQCIDCFFVDHFFSQRRRRRRFRLIVFLEAFHHRFPLIFLTLSLSIQTSRSLLKDF